MQKVKHKIGHKGQVLNKEREAKKKKEERNTKR